MEARELFARNLVMARGRLGISQEELAARANMNRTAVSLLERRGRDPRLATIVKLARGLEIKPAALLDGID